MVGYELGGALEEGGALGMHEQYLALFGYKIPRAVPALSSIDSHSWSKTIRNLRDNLVRGSELRLL